MSKGPSYASELEQRVRDAEQRVISIAAGLVDAQMFGDTWRKFAALDALPGAVGDMRSARAIASEAHHSGDGSALMALARWAAWLPAAERDALRERLRKLLGWLDAAAARRQP